MKEFMRSWVILLYCWQMIVISKQVDVSHRCFQYFLNCIWRQEFCGGAIGLSYFYFWVDLSESIMNLERLTFIYNWNKFNKAKMERVWGGLGKLFRITPFQYKDRRKKVSPWSWNWLQQSSSFMGRDLDQTNSAIDDIFHY